MPAEKDIAIVLRTVDFSESSVIATLFTREHGKISGLAKGAKRLKSSFDSAIDLLGVCRIIFLRKSSEALDLLTEAKVVRRFRLRGRSLAGFYAGCYVVELVTLLTQDYDPHPDLFDLTDRTLQALAQNEDVPRHVLAFEMGILKVLGYWPSLEICVGCGRDIVPQRNRVFFGLLDGGVLCPRCRPTRRSVMALGEVAWRILKESHSPGNRDASEMTGTSATCRGPWTEWSPQVQGELRGLINGYIRNLLGRKPRMHEYLGLLT
ncbi:DNA repair protein RecO [Thermostilla marina]